MKRSLKKIWGVGIMVTSLCYSQTVLAAPGHAPGFKVLYRADCQHGWAGWTAKGWAVRDGSLESDGTGALRIRAPYVPGQHHVNDYEIDAYVRHSGVR